MRAFGLGFAAYILAEVVVSVVRSWLGLRL